MFHFGWLQLKPDFLKTDMKLFITLLLVEPVHFQMGTKHVWNLANQLPLNFVSVIISVALQWQIYLCVCPCVQVNFTVCKQVNKIGGNKKNKQTFGVYPNFELIANESHCVSTLPGHLCVSFFFLKGFSDCVAGREKGRLLSSNLEQHVFNKEHRPMFKDGAG